MGLASSSGGKKDLNVELNLLPVFDILSVCICFLLMTVVWVEVRALETKQAIGGQSLSETDPKPSIWLSIDEKNNITVTFKSPKAQETSSLVSAKNGQIDWSKAQNLLLTTPSKKIESAHILPTKTTKYDQVIRLMDLLKQNGIKDVGLSPI
ncbi:MAG: biopolymer transporter ExbD [Bdellovibrionaceae bacterium]|nr:biopolymer transporter ExbD [Pseudobdellovibrionaceae bacterium]